MNTRDLILRGVLVAGLGIVASESSVAAQGASCSFAGAMECIFVICPSLCPGGGSICCSYQEGWDPGMCYCTVVCNCS